MAACQSQAPHGPIEHIDGIEHDRQLLEMARSFAMDGQVSVSEAKLMWEQAQADLPLTEIRRRTLRWSMEAFKYTDKAANFMQAMLRGEKPKSCIMQVGGVKYDRELYEMAERFAKDGQVSLSEAHELWEAALDAGKVTEIEKLTLEHCLKQHNFTTPAAKFLAAKLRSRTIGERRDGNILRWVWCKPRGSTFPAYPVVRPKREHRYSLVLCHPMGWGGGYYLGGGAIVHDLLSKSRLIRENCKILCPGAKKHKQWGDEWKMWFKYRGKDTGGTRQCHAQDIAVKDMQQSMSFISDVIDREARIVGSPQRVIVSGYSQGGCVSLATGLSLPYTIGLVVSQRGMLMKQTREAYEANGNSADARRPAQHILVTAGGKDDIYLEANQADSVKWLEAQGMKVIYKVFNDLDHGSHDKGEMGVIRDACVRAVLRADEKDGNVPLAGENKRKLAVGFNRMRPTPLKRKKWALRMRASAANHKKISGPSSSSRRAKAESASPAPSPGAAPTAGPKARKGTPAKG